MFVAKIDALVNVSQDVDITILNMQAWWECLKSLYYISRYTLSDTEVEFFDKIIDEINSVTDDKDFSHANLFESGKADKIKHNLEVFESEIWLVLGKYGFLVKRNKQKIYDSVEEQIEDENL